MEDRVTSRLPRDWHPVEKRKLQEISVISVSCIDAGGDYPRESDISLQ